MPRRTGTGNKLAIAATFIILEVAAIAMLASSSGLQNIWLNRISHRTIALLWGWSEDVRGRLVLIGQNEELAAENFTLHEQLREYEENAKVRAENAALCEVGGRDRFSYIPATVVKMSRNTLHNYIIINKGSEDGVKPHSGIITHKGVVGVIYAVDRHYSYGLTLMNARISVSARVGRNGIVAPLVWDGSSTRGAYLKDLPVHNHVVPKDTVYTSGFSTIFPEDLPVGLTGALTVIDGATCRAEVSLFQDFSSLKYVTVVDNLDRDEIMNLEQQVLQK